MTIDRHDRDRASGFQDEFWGEQTEWTPQPARSTERGGLAATVGRWWDALLGGGAVAARTHGQPTASVPDADDLDWPIERPPATDHASNEPVEDDTVVRDDVDGAFVGDDDAWDDAWMVEPAPQHRRHPGVDPLLARLGGLAVIVTLAAPLVVGFTSSGSEAQSADPQLAAISGVPASQLQDPTTTAGGANAAVAPASGPSPAAEPVVSTPASTDTDTVDAGDVEPPPSSSNTAAALTAGDESDAEAASSADTCGAEYELAAGDYWIRIADAAGVALSELLDVNDASVDTALVPGRSICLPVGAATPAAPTTIAPAPAPTSNARTATATTAAPSRPVTTQAPTTTAPTRPAAVSPSEAVAIIRQVWPDDLEERAIEIAWRESNHQSNVNNWCCYGLFQIHWEAHRSWLSALGVTSAYQLFDPTVNATAAYTLYQRAGGFGPWGG